MSISTIPPDTEASGDIPLPLPAGTHWGVQRDRAQRVLERSDFEPANEPKSDDVRPWPLDRLLDKRYAQGHADGYTDGYRAGESAGNAKAWIKGAMVGGAAVLVAVSLACALAVSAAYADRPGMQRPRVML